MPALHPLSQAPGVMPGQGGSEILRFAQNDRGGRMAEGGKWSWGQMVVDGIAEDTP